MMKTLKKALSVFLAVALLACLCIGMGMTGYAAGETITAEAVGTYDKSDAEQDVTIRISINGLSEPYCGFYIDDGVELPTGWTLKSYSTSNTAQPVGTTDVNSTKGSLNYATNDMTDSIPADTYYDAVITVPADVSGDFSIVFKTVYCAKNMGTQILVEADTVTASMRIKSTEPAEGYTVTVAAAKTTAAVNDTVEITLDVTNSDSDIATFNAFQGTLTYNATVFTYDGNSTIGEFNIDSSVSGKLTITRADGNVTIPGSGAELTLPFTAAAAGTGTFELSDAKVSKADNADSDAAAATVVGKPSVTVSQKYTVTFAGGDGATGTAPTQDPVTAGTKITLPAATAFTKEGYTFAGWKCSVDGVTYDAGASYTMTAAATTFTAQWTAIPTYAVTFDINGATGTAPTMAAQAEGKTFTLPDDTGLTREGYNFAGWKCSVDGVTYNAGASYTMTAAATTFTAQWTEKAATATASVVSDYLSGYTLIKVTTENTTKAPTYDGNSMFKLSGSAYDAAAYYYIVEGTVSASTAQDKLGWSDSAATTLTKDGDANQTGRIDINDAQFIYNLYNGVSVSYTPTAAQLLASDVNGDGKVGTDDCAAAIDKIQ